AHDTVDDARRASQVVKELWPEQDLFVLPVTKADLELCFVGLPNAEFYYLPELAVRDEKTVRSYVPQLDRLIDNALADGRVVLLTRQGQEALLSDEAASRHPGAAVVAEHLFEAFTATAVRRQGLSGWTLARR
ncbi:MAG: hypothetical protein V3U11_04505, partial [Planctomycetota bacterium]